MNKLRAIRDSQGATQQQIANDCGIALRTYQRIERGERKGDISIWQRLATCFNTPIESLLKVDENP